MLATTTDQGVATLRMGGDDGGAVLTAELVTELHEALRETRNSDVCVVVLTGTGSVFCTGPQPREGQPVEAGASEEETGKQPPRHGRATRAADLISALWDVPVPVIAAVNGTATGAGFALALAADLRIAAAGVSLGPGTDPTGVFGCGLPALLRVVVGRAGAARLLLDGGTFTAEQALTLGLVDEVVEPPALAERAGERATGIAARPDWYARGIVRALRASERLPFDEAVHFGALLALRGQER